MKCAITVSSSRYIYVLYTKKKKKAVRMNTVEVNRKKVSENKYKI